MKKFLLLTLTAVFGLSAVSAKEITFSFDGKTVANNGTVEFTKYEEFDWGTQTEVFIEPKIYISKDSSEPINLRSTSDYPVQLCIGGQCEASENILKENLTFDVNTPEDLWLDCSLFFDKGQDIVLPEITVKLEAWYASAPSNVKSMVVKMGNVAGVSDAITTKDAVTVNNRTLAYIINSGETDLTVFNLAGHAVSRHKVQGKGTISLASLPVGIYLFRVNGIVGKFIVK